MDLIDTGHAPRTRATVAAEAAPTRRQVLRAGATAVLATALLTITDQAADAPPGKPPLLVNHVGFTPGAGKIALAGGNQAVRFTLADARDGKSVREMAGKQVGGDLGRGWVGDFSDWKTPGQYEIRTDDGRASAFAIDANVYDSAIAKGVDYFSHQRCGDSKTGYHAPCHLDDGRRLDNGKHQDVSGGWHDACDLRKWLDATIYGMIGLARVGEIVGPKHALAERIGEEMRWGNRYFLKMQEPAGYVMNYCAGDDGNRFTDNRIGTDDDRPIHTEPAEMVGQFLFVTAEALAARIFAGDERERCYSAGLACYRWCVKERRLKWASDLAGGLIAAAELSRSTQDATLRAELRGQITTWSKQLLALQSSERDVLPGYFRAKPDDLNGQRDVQHGNLPLLALGAIVTTLADHPDCPSWKIALERHANYLTTMAERSAFGTIPFGIYGGGDPGGNRRVGDRWYRWFMKTRDETPYTKNWWVGINAHLASNGIGLLHAARLLQAPELALLAQRQLDWILGVNPFGCSTITGVGRNQPGLYQAGAFSPPTPLIDGGVMNGVGGTFDDHPRMDSGSWQTCEYWTPMTGQTLWLLAEIQG